MSTHAEVVPGGVIRIRSGPLPGSYIDSHRNRRGTNQQFVTYVHAAIERVLLPVHRSHPISRIILEGDSSLSHEEHARMQKVGVYSRRW